MSAYGSGNYGEDAYGGVLPIYSYGWGMYGASAYQQADVVQGLIDEMAEPVYLPWFEDLWQEQIPDFHRYADEAIGHPMKRWFGGIGNQFAKIAQLAERFLYIAPNDREIRHITPPPSGEQIMSTEFQAEVELVPPPAWEPRMAWAVDPWGNTVESAQYYLLGPFDDQDYVLWSHYLTAGTYQVQFNYIKYPIAGVATFTINGQDIATIPLQSGTWNGVADLTPDDIALSYPYEFTVERGYANIEVRFYTDVQTDDTQRINVGPFYITNISQGYEFGTSDLVNPRAANAEWLPWLAQLFGVRLDLKWSVPDQRDAILTPYLGFGAGTREALVMASKQYLTRTKTVRIYDHSIPNGINAGGQWDVLLVTRNSETPTTLDLPAELIKMQVKPAGVLLHHQAYEATWNVIEPARPQWDDWDGNSWTTIEETGLL